MNVEEKYIQQTKEWLCTGGRIAVAAKVATAGFAQHGRGHVLIFCTPRPDTPTFQYVLAETEPITDVVVPMIRDYDPTSEAVLLCFWGERFIATRVGFYDMANQDGREH